MDQDKSLNISYDEWRDFLMLAPSTDLHDILKFWRHTVRLNIFLDCSYTISFIILLAPYWYDSLTRNDNMLLYVFSTNSKWSNPKLKAYDFRS